MAEFDPELSLARNRARLRSLLVPDPETGRIEADVFPRSAAMKALVFGLPVVVALAARSCGRSVPWRQQSLVGISLQLLGRAAGVDCPCSQTIIRHIEECGGLHGHGSDRG